MRKLSTFALALLFLASSAAFAQFSPCSFGEGFCNAGGGGTPLVSCPSTGIYDLSNVCNDIYFIGALR